jgi:hypothetical protein
LRLAGLHAVAVTQTAGPQVGVQLRQVLHARHRCGPVALQVPHPPLDVRLLLRPARQTEERLEGIVTAQRQVAVVELPLATSEQLHGHGLGIVPPHFVCDATEKPEPFDQAVQDRLAALGRQRQRERAIRIGPGEEQHRHLAAALGEVHIDMSKVGFEPLPRMVVERDERLALPAGVREHVAADAVVTPSVAVLVAQPAKDLGCAVLLLGRCRLIGL